MTYSAPPRGCANASPPCCLRHTTPPRFAHRAIEGYARRIEGWIPNPSRRSERGSETAREERLFNDLIFRIFFQPGLIFL